MDRLITWLWPRTASATVVLLAIVVLIFNGMGWLEHSFLKRATNSLYPIFITVVLIELYLIRMSLDGKFRVRKFSSGPIFDKYLQRRLKHAEEVRVVHISSGLSKDRDYPEIIESFVKGGHIFSRIFCATANPEVIDWITEDLRKYEDEKYKYYIYLLKGVRMAKNTRTFGIMIIDNNEVCLGGGYTMKYTEPTISFSDPVLVKFFIDYYEYLKERTAGVRISGEPVHWEIMKEAVCNDV